MFKIFVIEYIKEMVKEEISTVISNLKLSMSNTKISLNTMKRFSMLTIDNKYTKNAPILQFLLKVLAGNIGVTSNLFC